VLYLDAMCYNNDAVREGLLTFPSAAQRPGVLLQK
jgi:hypothetical protein